MYDYRQKGVFSIGFVNVFVCVKSKSICTTNNMVYTLLQHHHKAFSKANGVTRPSGAFTCTSSSGPSPVIRKENNFFFRSQITCLIFWSLYARSFSCWLCFHTGNFPMPILDQLLLILIHSSRFHWRLVCSYSCTILLYGVVDILCKEVCGYWTHYGKVWIRRHSHVTSHR